MTTKLLAPLFDTEEFDEIRQIIANKEFSPTEFEQKGITLIASAICYEQHDIAQALYDNGANLKNPNNYHMVDYCFTQPPHFKDFQAFIEKNKVNITFKFDWARLKSIIEMTQKMHNTEKIQGVEGLLNHYKSEIQSFDKKEVIDLFISNQRYDYLSEYCKLMNISQKDIFLNSFIELLGNKDKREMYYPYQTLRTSEFDSQMSEKLNVLEEKVSCMINSPSFSLEKTLLFIQNEEKQFFSSSPIYYAKEYSLFFLTNLYINNVKKEEDLITVLMMFYDKYHIDLVYDKAKEEENLKFQKIVHEKIHHYGFKELLVGVNTNFKGLDEKLDMLFKTIEQNLSIGPKIGFNQITLNMIPRIWDNSYFHEKFDIHVTYLENNKTMNIYHNPYNYAFDQEAVQKIFTVVQTQMEKEQLENVLTSNTHSRKVKL